MEEESKKSEDKTGGQGYFNRGKIVRSIILLVVAGIVLNILVTLLSDRDKVISSILTIPWYGIAIPFLCYLLMYLIDALRLKILFRQFGDHIGLVDAYFNTTIGYFFGLISPLSAGQQPFMIYHLTALGHDSKTTTDIVFSRYVVYTLSVFMLLLVFSPVSFKVADSIKIGRFVIILGMLTSAFLSIGVLMLLIKPYFVGKLGLKIEHTKLGMFISKAAKREHWAEELYSWSMDLRENIAYLWQKKLPFMISDICLNLVNIGLMAFSLYYTIVAVDRNVVSFFEIFVTYLIVNIVVHYIPTPGGTGGYEAALTLILSQFLANGSLAVSSTVIWRFSTYYLQIFYLGIVFILFPPYFKRSRMKAAKS